jgi:hypothetical protein
LCAKIFRVSGVVENALLKRFPAPERLGIVPEIDTVTVQTVSDVRCANLKCIWNGPDHLCDHNADAEHGQFAPWVTLADGSKVVKYCSMQCWSSYRRDQMKLPESERDPDIGVILCSECGREVQMNSPKRGTRDCYCSVDCWPPMSDEQKRRIATLFDADRTRERRRAERKPRRADAPAPPGLASRKFPGSPRPKQDVLQEYRSWYDASAAKEPMWSIWYPAPEDVFRWRWQFDCGCIEERLTHSDHPQSILDNSDRDPYRSRQQLPHGQYLCRGEHTMPSPPLRDIASWDECLGRRLLPPDPVKPQYGIPDDVWALIRHGDQRWVTGWKATLTCGHQIEVQRNPDWTPELGLKRATSARLQEMRPELAKVYAPEPIPDHDQKMLDAGWPELGSYLDCPLCPIVRTVTAYEPVGWLVAPAKQVQAPRRKSRREVLEERIRRTERELKQLRKELDDEL